MDLPLSERDVAHETFFFSSWDHDRAWRTSCHAAPSWFSMTVPTLADPGLAPAGQHELILTTLVPYRTASGWRTDKERMTEHVLDMAERHVSGLRDRIRLLETATPRTMERYTRNTAGAIYGWELSPSQVGPGRLSQRLPIEGLHLAGHWTQPGGGIYGVVTSGIQTARQVLARDRAAPR